MNISIGYFFKTDHGIITAKLLLYVYGQGDALAKLAPAQWPMIPLRALHLWYNQIINIK